MRLDVGAHDPEGGEAVPQIGERCHRALLERARGRDAADHRIAARPLEIAPRPQARAAALEQQRRHDSEQAADEQRGEFEEGAAAVRQGLRAAGPGPRSARSGSGPSSRTGAPSRRTRSRRPRRACGPEAGRRSSCSPCPWRCSSRSPSRSCRRFADLRRNLTHGRGRRHVRGVLRPDDAHDARVLSQARADREERLAVVLRRERLDVDRGAEREERGDEDGRLPAPAKRVEQLRESALLRSAAAAGALDGEFGLGLHRLEIRRQATAPSKS